MDYSSKKMWTLAGSLWDHRDIMFSIPKIFDAYVGTNSIYPKMNESVMLAVNSVNNCPYCDGLHGQLGRIAGIPVKTVDKMLAAKDSDECASLVESPEEKAAVKYARIFAERNGREDSAPFKVLTEALGSESKAESVKALCWFLFWGSTTGNTVNAFYSRVSKCALRPDLETLFELFFFMVYGPLFFLVFVVMNALRVVPSLPAWASAAVGAVLTTVCAPWILFYGLASYPVAMILGRLCPSWIYPAKGKSSKSTWLRGPLKLSAKKAA